MARWFFRKLETEKYTHYIFVLSMVILLGFRAGFLDEYILNGMIILILITCVVSSLVTERATKKLILESENDNSELLKFHFEYQENILLHFANLDNIEKLLEFSIFIKDKKSNISISILPMMDNISEKMESLVPANNIIILYPKKSETGQDIEKFVGFSQSIPIEGVSAIDLPAIILGT